MSLAEEEILSTYLVTMRGGKGSSTSHLKMDDVRFKDIAQDEHCFFYLRENETKNGFDVDMKNLAILPLDKFEAMEKELWKLRMNELKGELVWPLKLFT